MFDKLTDHVKLVGPTIRCAWGLFLLLSKSLPRLSRLQACLAGRCCSGKAAMSVWISASCC